MMLFAFETLVKRDVARDYQEGMDEGGFPWFAIYGEREAAFMTFAKVPVEAGRFQYVIMNRSGEATNRSHSLVELVQQRLFNGPKRKLAGETI